MCSDTSLGGSCLVRLREDAQVATVSALRMHAASAGAAGAASRSRRRSPSSMQQSSGGRNSPHRNRSSTEHTVRSRQPHDSTLGPAGVPPRWESKVGGTRSTSASRLGSTKHRLERPDPQVKYLHLTVKLLSVPPSNELKVTDPWLNLEPPASHSTNCPKVTSCNC
jgi:hypothetical protein